MIKSFRGRLADGGQDTIRLGTNKGLIGYRINKFQIIPAAPGANIDAIVKVNKFDDRTIDGTIDFSDQGLIGVAWMYNDTYETDQTVIMDHVVFNQDVFVSHHEDKASGAINYYLELEQVKLDVNEAAVATLKDMRGSN